MGLKQTENVSSALGLAKFWGFAPLVRVCTQRNQTYQGALASTTVEAIHSAPLSHFTSAFARPSAPPPRVQRHEMGIAYVFEMFEIDGWNTRCLSALFEDFQHVSFQ